MSYPISLITGILIGCVATNAIWVWYYAKYLSPRLRALTPIQNPIIADAQNQQDIANYYRHYE